MFPLYWRFLIGEYLKATLLALFAFVAVLLTLRLEEIATFASLGASFQLVVTFIALQIPYILPIVLAISTLIGSFSTMRALCHSQEFTALRACGLALCNITAPILFTALFLSVANFYVISELATFSHYSTNRWKQELKSINPLFLLKNRQLMKHKGAYFEAHGKTQAGELAEKVIIAFPNKSSQRLHLLLAENLEASSDLFTGRAITTIAATPSQEGEFDHLAIENSLESRIHTQDFSQLFDNKALKSANDYLSMGQLLAKLDQQKREAIAPRATKEQKQAVKRSLSEIIRRFSLALAPFTFTLLGLSYGMTIGRERRYRNTALVLALVSLYLTCYFIATGQSHRVDLSVLYYILPHAVLIASALWNMRQVARGVE